MAMGGGVYNTQNKTLPGSYINFVSLAQASRNTTDRGVAALGVEWDWGQDDGIMKITVQEAQENALKLFGYAYGHDKLKGIRDIFRGAHTLYIGRLNKGTPATCQMAQAKWSGVRGNALRIVVRENVNDTNMKDVLTFLENQQMDSQTVSTQEELKDNDFVVWDRVATLELTAGMPLAGGTNGAVTGEAHTAFLEELEGYAFHALGAVVEDDTTKQMYANYCRRMRDELGVKFQTVLYNYPADFEGCINVKNKVTDDGWSAASAVYWVTGVSAGCAINESNMNRVYDGEFTMAAKYTQTELMRALEQGEYVLHKVGDTVRVLQDINSLVSFTAEKEKEFGDNQTIRVIDQVATNVANIFSAKYIGKVVNNEAGRIGLQSEIIKDHKEMQQIGAIEGFDESAVVVSAGATPKAVVLQDAIKVTSTMGILYMTVTVG